MKQPNDNAAPKKATRKQLENAIGGLLEQLVSSNRMIDYSRRQQEIAEEVSDDLVRQRNVLQQQKDALDKAATALDNTRIITAQGLQIERDELLVRVAKLNMRIRGLGFQA